MAKGISREVMRGLMEKQIEEARQRIRELEAKRKSDDEDSREYLRNLEELIDKHKQLEEKLELLRRTGQEEWEVVREGVDRAVDEMKKVLKKHS